MPSISDSSSFESPISQVPYDVLVEIFVHCLPRYPLKNRQPDTTIAPMLLCQVCSSWRMVALASTTLWSHLSYSLIITYADVFALGVHKDQITFLRWWKKNQGSVPPFLCLDIWWREDNISKDQEYRLEGLNMRRFLEYLSSAQYLDVDQIYWRLLLMDQGNGSGNQALFPNLHTLVKFGRVLDDPFYPIQALISSHTPSALRHLSIRHDTLFNSPIPIHWITLTHISLEDDYIPLNFWFSLLRAVPDLQWGYFHIKRLIDIGKDYPKFPRSTLPHLSTLFIAVRGLDGNPVEFPLSLLFTDLYLPSLRTLSVSSCEGSWRDYRATTELYTVLKSTPAITTLILGEHFLSLYEPGYNTATVAARDVEPVWRHATQLVHLQLELSYTGARNEAEAAEALNTFVRNAFFSNSSWLDLGNPKSPLRAITIIDKMPSNPRFDSIREFTVSSIRKQAKKAPNIIFEITPESAIQTAEDAWYDWGSKI